MSMSERIRAYVGSQPQPLTRQQIVAGLDLSRESERIGAAGLVPVMAANGFLRRVSAYPSTYVIGRPPEEVRGFADPRVQQMAQARRWGR